MVGSLTGAVSSHIVTEEYEGILGTVGHRTDSAMAKGCLTARLTSRAGAKAGHSDPVVLFGNGIARVRGLVVAQRRAIARRPDGFRRLARRGAASRDERCGGSVERGGPGAI